MRWTPVIPSDSLHVEWVGSESTIIGIVLSVITRPQRQKGFGVPRMITNLILLILVVSCLSEEQPTSNEVVIAQKGSSLYHWHERRAELREAKLTQLIAKIQLTNVPEPFDPIKGSALHNPTGQAVFTVAMDTTYMRRDARNFVKTLRLTGYKGRVRIRPYTLALVWNFRRTRGRY